MLRIVARGFLLLCVTNGTTALAQTIFPEPKSPRIANYHIRVSLDDSAKTTQGTVTLTWHNPSHDAIPDLQFHLYGNAFQNARSTFIRESLGNAPWAKDDGWGAMRITHIEVRGEDLTGQMGYISPDDGNPDDQTVLQVLLRQPVQPQETITVAMTFAAKIPHNYVRTGWWGDDFFFMVQWFPKIGVYETPGMRFVPPDASTGKWNCHQFHSGTEFYADFGVYDVEMTVPPKFTVASSGIIVREEKNDDGSKTVFAHAEDVHDFAWLADASVLDLRDQWENHKTGQRVQIRLLLQPGHEIAEEAYFSAAKYTLDFFDNWLGSFAYPYPLLTIVDPQPGSGAGGMEYPTLITGGLFYIPRFLTGGNFHDVEFVTIHELGHQYWYGMVANNEFEEAFLDEGFNTYTENRLGKAMFGERNSLLDFMGLHASLEAVRRIDYATGEGQHDAKLTDFSFSAPHSRTFAYNKWSLALKTLENYLGTATFDNVMRTYFWRWQFKHPCRNDFIQVANEVSGQDLRWFFDQIIFGDGVVDYGVAGVASVPLSTFEKGGDAESWLVAMGAADSVSTIPRHALATAPTTAGHTPTVANVPIDSMAADSSHFLSRVLIRRLGDVVIPVEILLGFADGTEQLEKWDGKERVHSIVKIAPTAITRVVIDPERKIPLDVNLLNNSQIPTPPQFMRKYQWKWFFWMQSLLAFFGSLS